MSLVDKPQPAEIDRPEPGSPGDPFRLGWRHVRRTLADGTIEYDQIPLTLEDLLHPEEDDQAMHTQPHVIDCFYLFGFLRLIVQDDPRTRAVGDCRVDFAIPGVKPLGPDIAVFHDVPEGWGRATLDIGALGARPVLVVEVTSPDTRPQDFNIKKDYYHRAGVQVYVIVDSRYRGDIRYDVRIVAFRFTPAGYEPIPLDDRGRLWVDPFQFWMTIEDGRVRCFAGREATPIGSFEEEIQKRFDAQAYARDAETRAQAAADARRDAETRAQAEFTARRDAEAHARDAETRAQAESTARRDAEAHARDAETRAQAESAARIALEAQMAALQAELRRLRGDE